MTHAHLTGLLVALANDLAVALAMALAAVTHAHLTGLRTGLLEKALAGLARTTAGLAVALAANDENTCNCHFICRQEKKN